MSDRQTLYLRPTLVIGLGGSGYRIAVELKARLEERLGESSGYRRVVKFLCFDTANENFTAQYPNNPEVTVAMSVESEFVRISDVPLHDLMRSRDTNAAIASILPEVLYTTQIDQGAQQVRRLGRVALFYHYGRVKEKLTGAISSLRQIDVIGQLGVSSDGHYDVFVNDRNRLRVLILCSICGGTGSGTFIDMAYLVRHIAEGTGISPRACDVNGMLLLPEAFPNIITTGAARIRANAYAALLDVEHYNQAANIDQPLYEVRMPGEMISVSGAPFSICYLVGGGGSEGPIGDIRQLSPILADALEAVIATPIGTKLDATLDNVRVGLSLDYQGFRTFYSAIGVAQIVHPELEMRRTFNHMLKEHIINERLLKPYVIDEKPLSEAVEDWFKKARETMRRTLRGNIRDEDGLTRRLRQLENDIGRSTQPLSDFADAYRETTALFQRNVEELIERSTTNTRRELEEDLRKTVWSSIDDALASNQHGLHYARAWLDRLSEHLQTSLKGAQRRKNADLSSAYDREISYIEQVRSYPVVGRLFFMRGRIAEACGNLNRFVHSTAVTAVLDNAERGLFNGLNRIISDLRREIQGAITYWEDVRLRESAAAKQKPRITAVTQYTLSDDMIIRYTRSAIDALTQEERAATVYAELYNAFNNKGKRSLSRSLDSDARADLILALDRLCDEHFRTAIQSADFKDFTDDVTEYLEKLSKVDALREQYNTLLVNLRTQAQPLLIFNTGNLQALPPAQIRVIGGKNEEAIKRVWTGGASEQSDVNYASTFDPSRLMYLVTFHGIPINTLSKFDEYRRHYEDMKSARNAIFHLDNAREDEPHDPKSMYFINLEDYQSRVARALAYGCISRVEDHYDKSSKFVFVLSSDFYTRFTNFIDRKLTEFKDQIADIDAALTKQAQRDDKRNIDIARKKALEAQRDELKARKESFTKLNTLKTFEPKTDDAQAYALPVWRRGIHTGVAENLTDAVDSFYGGGARLFAMLFMRAVDEHESDTNPEVLRKAIDVFLETRKYVGSNHTENTTEIINYMLYSRSGQDDYKLELHLCALLAVYRRLKSQDVLKLEWIPAGYHLLARGYLENKPPQNGSPK